MTENVITKITLVGVEKLMWLTELNRRNIKDGLCFYYYVNHYLCLIAKD